MIEVVLFIVAVVIFLLLDTVKPAYGIVYDAHTGEYVDTAYVVLHDADTGAEITRQLTDMYGRYYFFVSPGKYTLSVERTHFHMIHPYSPVAALYGAPYMGGTLSRRHDSVISLPIALQQDEYDWNHENKLKLKREIAGNKRYYRWTFLFIAFVHLCMSISTFLQNGSAMMGVVTVAMLAWWGFFLHDHTPVLGRMQWKEGKHFGGFVEVLGYANVLIRKAELTRNGNYWTLVSPDEYTVVVHEYIDETKQESAVIGRYENVPVPTGVLNKSLLID